MKYKSLCRKIFGLVALLLMIGYTGFSQLAVGTIPKGDSIVIRHDVTIIASPPLGTDHIAAQWTIQGTNFSNFVSDDPDTVTPLDSTITVLELCPTIIVTNPVTTTGTAGTAFSQTFIQSGGTLPVTFTTVSTLPTGLSLSTAGVLSGTPTQTGTFPIIVKATDAGGCAGNGATYNLVISCPAPITGIATPSSQTICSANPITTIVLSGAPTGAVYNWTRDNTVAVTGIAASGSGNISGTLTNTASAPVTVTFTITPTYFGICLGTPYTATVLVNPTPDAVATPASQTICSGSSITTIVLSGAVSGTVFNWTRDNTVAVTGIAASGAGDISGSLTNTTNAPVTVTFTITPTANGCSGTPITATVLVNPTPNAVATPASQTICSAGTITTIVLSGSVAGTVYNWTRDNTVAVTGIAASGAGNISGALTNTTTAPVTVTFTITPTANGCPGTPITAIVLVNPTPNAVATPASQTICSAATITTIVLSGAVTGTTYNWTRDNTVSVTGIAASGVGNISGSLTNTTTAPVTVTFTITPTANGCPGAPITATVLVNPTPTVTAVPASQTKCSAVPITTIVLSGNAVAGVVYNWTRDNVATVTGIAASGSGNISGTLTNTTNAPVTVTFTITPTANGCPGTPITATVLVNPTPNAVATPSSQTKCSGVAITTIVLTGNVAGTVYNWVRDNTVAVTGIAASGSGDISGSLTNTTNAPVTVTFTITPTANGCFGTPITATVLVNPTPNTVATPASQTICSGNAITTIALTGAVSGTTFNWTRDNTVAVTGIAASGSGDISGTLTNTTNAPVTVTFTITPTANGCPGTPITATVLVNPTPDAVATPSSQTICSGSAITNIVLTGAVPATTFNWVRDNTVAVTGIAASGAGDISGSLTNTTNAPVIVTFTITPTANGCFGTPITATVLVNPTPNAVATPASQTICSGNAITTIALTGAVSGTTFNWTRDNTVAVTGIVASGSGDISGTLINTTLVNVTVTFTITPTANGCTGAPITATVLVKPTPTAVATPSSQTICSGSVASISITGNLGSLPTYNWTRDNTVTVTGIAASGSGNIIGSLTNTTNAPVTVTFTITPTYNGCTGTPITATVLVNPTPNAVATPASQTICSAGSITTIVLTGAVAGTTFNWTRDNTAAVTGIANSGSGNISGTLTNTTFAPITVTFTITPTANGCPGAAITATVLVNPTPNAVAAPVSQTICSANPITTIVLSGAVAGTTYNWTRDNTGTVTGIPANGGGGNISGSLTNTTNVPVTVTFTITPTANGCPGTPITATVLVNPTPNAVATPASQTICSDGTITTIVLTGAVSGTSFTWTRNNTVTVTGIANSGSGNISGTLTNTTNAPITVTFTIIPSANSCPGAPITATVLVNPTPNAVATPASQTICSAGTITTIVLSGAVAGTTYNWTRDNTVAVTGIGASGSGNISGTLTNTTFAPVIVTFTITPIANGCPGPSITATVLVNPTPNAVAAPASQTICSGTTITSILLSGAVSGTTFTWTRNNTVAVTGIAASGSGNISGSLTNTTTAPVTVTFTITPTANGCPGPSITATVLVNPLPNAVATPASQTICSAGTITTIVLSSAVAGTTYNWTRDNTITVTGIANSGSGNISGSLTNTTNVPVTVTFTITPTANGCPGSPITATVLVNPTPDAVAFPASQTVCSDNLIIPIILSGNVAGTTFNWTRNNTATVLGIAASGSGNISGTLTNTTNAPILVTFTITPIANGCPGTPITATVLTYPTPSAVATPATQTICTGATITTIVLSGPVAGTTFSWTRNNTGTVTGIAASGTGNISGALTNTTNAPITVTFTITTIANGCIGSANTATVVVNPTPTITCPANIVVNAAAGTCSAVVNYPPATATGTPAPTITYSIPSGSSFAVGVTTVTATATNICGTATCSFTITVNDVRVPLISSQPVNSAVCIGNSAAFSVVATNVVSYQWQILNGNTFGNIVGATASSFTVNNTTLSMNNNIYRVALTGPCGTIVFSNPVTLVVNPLPLITLSSLSTPVLLPNRTTTITATTYPPGGSFAWLFNGSPMTGITGSSLGPLTVENIGRYNVIYTDPNGCVSTSADFVVSLEVTNYLWVYPNPNTGQFNVRYYNRTGEAVTLKVFNGLGQVVYAQSLALGTAYSNIQVNMSNVAAGVYKVKIMNGTGAELNARRILIYHP